MSWVIQTIVKILLGACVDVFVAFSDDFISAFGINIGADFPSVASEAKGNSPSLAKILSEYPNDNGLSSVFDNFFPLGSYKVLFVSMALVIATALLIVEIMRAMSSPMIGGKKQKPVISVMRYTGCVVGIIISYRMFIILEYLANEFYLSFAKIAMNTKEVNGDVSIANESTRDSFSSLLMDPGSRVTNLVGDLALSILSLVIAWMLLLNFMRLLIEIVERYVVLGLLFYTAPLPFAALVSDNTADVFKSWVRMTVSEMLLIVTNSLFLGTFIGAVRKVAPSSMTKTASDAVSGLISYGMGGGEQLNWVIEMFMLIAWLQIAQKFDSYLKGLGLATAQTGGGLASAVVGAFSYGVGKSVGMGKRAVSKSPGGQAIAGGFKVGGIAGAAAVAKGLGSGIEGAAMALNRENLKNDLIKNGYRDVANAAFGSTKNFSPENLEKNKGIANKTAQAMGFDNPATRKAIDESKGVAFDNGKMSILSQDGSKLDIDLTGSKPGQSIGSKGVTAVVSDSFSMDTDAGKALTAMSSYGKEVSPVEKDASDYANFLAETGTAYEFKSDGENLKNNPAVGVLTPDGAGLDSKYVVPMGIAASGAYGNDYTVAGNAAIFDSVPERSAESIASAKSYIAEQMGPQIQASEGFQNALSAASTAYVKDGSMVLGFGSGADASELRFQKGGSGTNVGGGYTATIEAGSSGSAAYRAFSDMYVPIGNSMARTGADLNQEIVSQAKSHLEGQDGCSYNAKPFGDVTMLSPAADDSGVGKSYIVAPKAVAHNYNVAPDSWQSVGSSEFVIAECADDVKFTGTTPKLDAATNEPEK